MLADLQAHPDLVVHILRYEHQVRNTIEQFKAVAQLVDGSRLHANEVWIAGELQKYAYYWLTPTDNVIRGWDNAPHHPEVETFPHHMHHSGAVYSSTIRSFQDILILLDRSINRE
ncbi:MAG: hypothetical protein IPF56_21460 [Chloroflexi bacterium]|nr:hypothetical protein [Chloroflexota bacterium]